MGLEALFLEICKIEEKLLGQRGPLHEAPTLNKFKACHGGLDEGLKAQGYILLMYFTYNRTG